MNKLFHRLIASVVLITTVSIPEITLAGDRQPETISQRHEQFCTILDKGRLNDDQRQKRQEEIKEWYDRICPNERKQRHSQVQTSPHQEYYIIASSSEVQTNFHSENNIISSPVRITGTKANNRSNPPRLVQELAKGLQLTLSPSSRSGKSPRGIRIKSGKPMMRFIRR